MSLRGKSVLLIIGGGIAAYKSLELVRRLRERGVRVRAILTRAGAEFVTALSVSSLTGEKTWQDLFSLTDEAEMGHIQLSRAADLLVVAPATADLMAKLAQGHASDLASTALLATDKPILLAPAMNVRMWNHAATQRNLARLTADGVISIGPNEGEMACGEFGPGRMAEPEEIVEAIETLLVRKATLAGRKALVTAGPTREPLDPVRYLANRSSGKQGYAIAAALAEAGADTTLVSGPVDLAPPHKTFDLFADRPRTSPSRGAPACHRHTGFEQCHRGLTQIGVGGDQLDQRHVALQRLAHQATDQPVGLAEGHALLDEHLGQVDGRGGRTVRRRLHALLVPRGCLVDAA